MNRNGIYSYFDVYEQTLECLKKRKEIVKRYDMVPNYNEAVWQIARFLNAHLRFMAKLQGELPELLVIAWHYAKKEFGCPLKESEYESFVEALRVDVYRLLNIWTKKDVGMKEFYRKNKH